MLLSPQVWAEATFGAVQLGDPRRTRRAVAIAQAMAREPGASLPKQLHDQAAWYPRPDHPSTFRGARTPGVARDGVVSGDPHRARPGQYGR